MGNKINYGIVGILSVLIGLSGSLLLNQSELEKTYICTANERVAVFDHLSSTSKTGYWVDENNATRRAICRNGIWMKLPDYIEITGKHINFLEQENKERIKYRCDQLECVEI